MNAAKSKTTVQLIVGGESRVDLLPPEVASRARSRSTRRALIGAVAVTGMLVAGGYVFAAMTAGASTAGLISAQSEATALLQQQGAFSEVRQVEADLLGAQAAKAVGASTEIDWKSYFAVLDQTLPDGAALRALALESATPIEAVPVVTDIPLRAPSVATITLEISSPAIIDVKSWLVALQSVPGFVDATPKTVTRQDDGSYRAAVILHLNEAAHWNRFVDEVAADTDDEPASGSTESGK